MENIIVNNNIMLISKAKIGFQTIQNTNITSKDLTFIQFISSSIIDVHFHNMIFYNASFLSTKLSDVFFDQCNLTCTDICSIWAENCFFTTSDFSDANISDSTFIKCTFDHTKFERISMINCQFIDCIFEEFPITDSSFALNTFTGCTIKNTNFTESFYYQMFENCMFQNVNMPVNLLGYNFGFSEEEFEKLRNGADLYTVENDFLNKGLFINAAILRINQARNYYDQAIIACAMALKKMIQNDILVKADEVRFLKEITTYLEKSDKLVPASILRVWQILNSLIEEENKNVSICKTLPYIQEYANTLYFCFQKFQEHIQENLNKFPECSDPNKTIVLKIVFKVAPKLSFLSLLEDITLRLSPKSPLPQLIRTEHGSYIEILKVASAIIPYLQTIFGFLGVLSPFVVRHLDNKTQTIDKTENDSNSIRQASISQTIVKTDTCISLPNKTKIYTSTNIVISGAVQIMNEIKITDSTDFAGYNVQNIQSIIIS